MVLHHVADGADLFVKCAPALDAEILRHRDLHALDVVTVPERFQHRVGKAEEQHVMHRLLAEIMVNAKNRVLVEGLEQDGIECLGRGQVAAERFFNDDPRIVPRVQSDWDSCSTTVPNAAGGMAR